MRKGSLLIALSVLFFVHQNSAQLLSGRVLAESGDRAAAVTVQFQNKSNLVITDNEGRFRIMASKLPDTLTFSAPGYEPYKVVITEKNIKDVNFEVVLLNTRKAMDEVVVTALGAKREAKELGYSSMEVRPGDVYIAGTTRVRGVATTPYSSGSTTAKYKSSTYDASSSLDAGRYYFRDTAIIERPGELAKSRILTAGEVNDFLKWKMWEDYNASEFKFQSRYWNLYTTHRYSVLLTDQKHNAIINEPVYLINKLTGDTAWKTFSDHTGRAELWGSLFDSSGKADYYISTMPGEKNNNPVEFSNGLNHLQLNKSCNFSNQVDMAFVVDATGSMGDEIEFLKLELEDVIRNTMDKYSSLTLRAASVFYRDRGDVYLTKHVDFNDDLLKTLNFIKLQEAGGGGDHPEAVDDAFATALDSLHWSTDSRIRLMFLVLDAPPHAAARERMEKLIAKAAAMGIHVIPLACSGTDKSTEFLLRSIALATNGTYAFLTDHSGVGNKHIEPTTDKYSVELLNTLLQRIIGQYLYAKNCDETKTEQLPLINQPDNNSGIKIYPNPTTGRFTVESKKSLKEIYIADFSGKILQRLTDPSGKSNKQRWNADISQYASGTYLVKYISEDNKWGAAKVVLVH
jgi:hypothetical protein